MLKLIRWRDIESAFIGETALQDFACLEDCWDGHGYGYFVENKLVGFITLSQKPTSEILLLWVNAEHRGQGIGRKLVNFAGNEAQCVIVDKSNEVAMHLYKSAGLTEPYHETEFAVTLKRSLASTCTLATTPVVDALMHKAKALDIDVRVLVNSFGELVDKLINPPSDKVDIVVFFIELSEMKLRTHHHKAYVSTSGRICFREYPALFNGMSPKRLRQFQFEKNLGTKRNVFVCRMVTTMKNFHEDRSRFLMKALRAQQRLIQQGKMHRLVDGVAVANVSIKTLGSESAGPRTTRASVQFIRNPIGIVDDGDELYAVRKP